MIWCIKTYIIAYVKTQRKKLRYIIHYVKPTAQHVNPQNYAHRFSLLGFVMAIFYCGFMGSMYRYGW